MYRQTVLPPEPWDSRLEALDQLIAAAERQLIWQHLNGGTHDNEDRDDFERAVVQRVVDALGRICDTGLSD